LRSKQKLKIYLIINIFVDANNILQIAKIKKKDFAFAREQKEQKELF